MTSKITAFRHLEVTGYEAAHGAALGKYGASPFSIYHPEVIKAFPTEFNNAWRAFWGLQ